MAKADSDYKERTVPFNGAGAGLVYNQKTPIKKGKR